MRLLNNFPKIKKIWILLFIIILAATFLRFYHLGNIPSGLLNDEANTGYDSFSLLLTGKDQWGSFLPLTNFIGFGDFPPPIYRYLSVIPIYFFGLSAFSVRFISAIAGVLSVIAIFLLGRRLFNEKVGLFASIFLAIMPWAIGLSRVGIESNLACLFILLSIYYGMGENRRSLFVSAFFAVLSMFTYSAYILFAPLIFILLVFLKWKGKLKISQLFLVFIFFILICSPLLIHKNSANTRFSQVGLTSNISSIGLINTLNDERGECLINFPSPVCKLLNNKILVFSNTFLNNYLSHFSPNFIYLNGNPTQYSILPSRGFDFAFNIAFMLLGLAFLFKNLKDKNSAFILAVFFLSVIPDSLTGNGNFSRASLMIPFLALINGLGLNYLLNLKLFKKVLLRKSFIVALFAIVGFSLISFFIIYLTYFKTYYSTNSQYGYQDLMTKVNNVKMDYDKIYISRNLNDTKQYIYYLFYSKYSPQKYQSKNNVSYTKGGDGWYSIERIDNIYFVISIPDVTKFSKHNLNKILLISTPVDFPKNIKYQFVVKDKLGNIIFKAVNASDLLEYLNQQKKNIINETN